MSQNTKADELKKKIREFIIANFLFGNVSKTFTDTDSFYEKGIIDSTGMLEMITFIEAEYGIAINDDELIPENLDSLHNLSAFIIKKKG